MVNWALGALWLLLAVSAPPDTYVPAKSPFSWSVVQDPGKRRPAAFDERILGASNQPASIALVDFHDERPCGDVVDGPAWLVRYEHVLIPPPEGKAPADVSVSLVLRDSTNQLLAAFTDAAAMWPESGWSSADIVKRLPVSWQFFPLQSPTLQSSVVEVLRHVWDVNGGDPTLGGQITLRPRQFLRTVTILDPKGNPLPKVKANGWVVEVLGKKIGVNPFGMPVCTQVYVYRDGDFEFCGGLQI